MRTVTLTHISCVDGSPTPCEIRWQNCLPHDFVFVVDSSSHAYGWCRLLTSFRSQSMNSSSHASSHLTRSNNNRALIRDRAKIRRKEEACCRHLVGLRLRRARCWQNTHHLGAKLSLLILPHCYDNINTLMLAVGTCRSNTDYVSIRHRWSGVRVQRFGNWKRSSISY